MYRVRRPAGGGDDDLNRLAQGCVVDTKGDALADQPGGVEDFLDLGRADPIARGLDHLVAPADEIEEPLVVHAHGIAGEHGDLGQTSPARVPAHGR